MTARGRAAKPEVVLARFLGQLARQKAATRIFFTDRDAATGAGAQGALSAPSGVVAIAEQTGLIEAVPGEGHRILPAGLAWLKRRLSGGEGYLDQHREMGEREIMIGGERQRVAVNEQESPLAWLRHRTGKSGEPILSDAQFEAGERLRSDFFRGGLSPRVTAAWDGLASSSRTHRGAPGDAVHLRDSVVQARQRFRQALETVGPELAGILLDVCCHLKGLEAAEQARGWPQRSGKVVLLLALSRLARHYGLMVVEKPPARPPRIMHWGDKDYRPTAAAWTGNEAAE
jgi:hypothetical protein